jgi:uncharacterized protein YlzI (FlbEa/FlbD family)
MLRDIYNEKSSLDVNKIKEQTLRSNPNVNIDIINNRSIIIDESNEEDVSKSIKQLMRNKQIDPSMIYNKMPLQNDLCIINI